MWPQPNLPLDHIQMLSHLGQQAKIAHCEYPWLQGWWDATSLDPMLNMNSESSSILTCKNAIYCVTTM